MLNPEMTLRGHSQFTREDRVAVLTGIEEKACLECGAKWKAVSESPSDTFYKVEGGFVCSPCARRLGKLATGSTLKTPRRPGVSAEMRVKDNGINQERITDIRLIAS
jgi:hypothetical protein